MDFPFSGTGGTIFQRRLYPGQSGRGKKKQLRTSNGKSEWLATLSGRLKHDADGMYPVTGDWVLMTDAVISRVLERKNALSRGASGTRNKQNAQPQKQQMIAANLDTVRIPVMTPT